MFERISMACFVDNENALDLLLLLDFGIQSVNTCDGNEYQKQNLTKIVKALDTVETIED